MSNKPVLVLGAGGHASVLVEILLAQDYEVVGVVSPIIDCEREIFKKFTRYEDDSIVQDFSSSDVLLVNGVGSLPNSYTSRAKITEKFSKMGYRFASLVSDKAVVSSFAIIEEGVQVMAGAILQAGVKIDPYTIVNTGAIVDHDCKIGMNNHIAPGVTLSGNVITGSNVHVGTAATVIQNITLGDNVVVGAGAVVTKSIARNHKIFGFRSDAILNQGVAHEP